jgi:hypothetical protein
MPSSIHFEMGLQIRLEEISFPIKIGLWHLVEPIGFGKGFGGTFFEIPSDSDPRLCFGPQLRLPRFS